MFTVLVDDIRAAVSSPISIFVYTVEEHIVRNRRVIFYDVQTNRTILEIEIIGIGYFAFFVFVVRHPERNDNVFLSFTNSFQ